MAIFIQLASNTSVIIFYVDDDDDVFCLQTRGP